MTETIHIGRPGGAFTGSGDLGRGPGDLAGFGMNAKVNAQKELSQGNDQTRTMTTLLQDTAIWFEEKVVTDLPADRQEEAQCGSR